MFNSVLYYYFLFMKLWYSIFAFITLSFPINTFFGLCLFYKNNTLLEDSMERPYDTSPFRLYTT